ncbi:MAG: hypothetical protein J6C05_08890 [Prevotella sp.]|nr:hypothetical protein [Prevotella sp.]MBO5157224.1 hypothetical protein [Prevotella sp.]
MKTEDFEKAIDALGYKIDIDEIKINGGQVRMCFGHTGSTLIMWDNYGIAYSTEWNIEEDGEIDHDTHDRVSDSCYNRDENFDLKFSLSDYARNKYLRTISITLSNGNKYRLLHSFRIYTIDKKREAIFVFDDGDAFKGFSDGKINEEGEISFSLVQDGKYKMGKPYESLIGWQYFDNIIK